MMLSKEEQEKIRQQIRNELQTREKLDTERAKRQAKDGVDGEEVSQSEEQQQITDEINRLKREEEDRFYRENPNYVQYVDRFGQKRWIHRQLFEEKRRRSLKRLEARKKARWEELRKYLIVFVAIIAVIASVVVFINSLKHPVLIVRSNVPDASIFIDNLLTSYVTDAVITNISSGHHKIAIYKAGFETKFVPVVVLRGDTLSIMVQLDSLQQTSVALRYGETRDFSGQIPVEPIEKPRLPQTTKRTQRSSTRSTNKASVFITSNQSDAIIYMDGEPIASEINTIIDNIQLGSHTFEVRKPGYISDPTYSTVRLKQSGELVSLSFELTRGVSTLLHIKTEPVSGEIFLNGRPLARGVYQEPISIGDYTVGFGNVPGYRTPDPQEISITDINPQVEVTGVYIPHVYVEISLGDDGQLIRRNCRDVTVGYYYPDQGAIESFEYGPTIEKIQSQGIYYWELGYAFARRNPPGSDFIEVHFDLPEHYDQNENIMLELHGYGSHDNYLFYMAEGNALAVDVNNKEVIPHFTPSSILDEGQPIGVDNWQIRMHLHEGENAVRVRTTEDNHCFYYLRRIVIRSVS